MSIWRWLTSRGREASEKAVRLDPECRWVVHVDDDRVGVTSQDGETRELMLADLRGVIVETNDTGPVGADVWWILFGADDRVACAFPQGATGETAVIEMLMTLPGFDHAAMIRAMASTDNAVFPVWRAGEADA